MQSQERAADVDWSAPLAFVPQLRPQVWGGQRLRVLGKSLPDARPYGESWEISPLAGWMSRAATGPHRGMPLDEIWAQAATHFCQGAQRPPDRFPWLLKWLDCEDWLSVQVHPDRSASRKWLGADCPKSEAWVILEADPNARVYAGFRPGVTLEEVEERIGTDTLLGCLNSFAPRAGDCISLPAGTVHAVGGGILLAEVQQPSDATFRLFDWRRAGEAAQARPLQIREALDTLRWPQPPIHPLPPTPWLQSPAGATGETLLQAPEFCLDRLTVHATAQVQAERLAAWMVLDGGGELAWRDVVHGVARGDTWLVPAAAQAIEWRRGGDAGPLTLLRITLPPAS